MTLRPWMLALPLALLVPMGLLARIGNPSTPGEAAPQVTLFGVRATPGEATANEDLAAVEGQLRKLLPDHGFKLLSSKSRPLKAGQSIRSDLGEGWSATVQMLAPADDGGKLRMKVTLRHDDATAFQRVVRTPPNQLFFCDLPLADGDRLVVGMGGR